MTSAQPVSNPIHPWSRLARVASLAFVPTGVVNTILGPILPVLNDRWHISDSQSGYFFVAQFVASILGVSLSSALLPRYGFRFNIGLGYLFLAAGLWGLLLAPWRLALCGTFVFGLGLGLCIPSTNLLISDLNRQNRAAALSILNLCWGIGAVAAPLIISLADRWKLFPALAPALSASLLLALVALVLSPEESRPIQEHASNQKIFSLPFALVVAGMFFLYVAVEASVGGWIATLAERASQGLGQSWALAPAGFWAGLLAGRAAAPLLLKMRSERFVTLAGLSLACLGISALMESHHRGWITLAGLVTGSGLAAVYPITIGLLGRFGDAEKRIAGPMFGLAGLGGALMPWAVGAISTWSGSLRIALSAPMMGTIVLFCLHAMAYPATSKKAGFTKNPA